jgi:hypothetical protein
MNSKEKRPTDPLPQSAEVAAKSLGWLKNGQTPSVPAANITDS